MGVAMMLVAQPVHLQSVGDRVARMMCFDLTFAVAAALFAWARNQFASTHSSLGGSARATLGATFIGAARSTTGRAVLPGALGGFDLVGVRVSIGFYLRAQCRALGGIAFCVADRIAHAATWLQAVAASGQLIEGCFWQLQLASGASFHRPILIQAEGLLMQTARAVPGKLGDRGIRQSTELGFLANSAIEGFGKTPRSGYCQTQGSWDSPKPRAHLFVKLGARGIRQKLELTFSPNSVAKGFTQNLSSPFRQTPRPRDSVKTRAQVLSKLGGPAISGETCLVF